MTKVEIYRISYLLHVIFSILETNPIKNLLSYGSLGFFLGVLGYNCGYIYGFLKVGLQFPKQVSTQEIRLPTRFGIIRKYIVNDT